MISYESATARRVIAVIVHYGDSGRTIQAVMRHARLDIFSDIVVVANDLSERPRELENTPCTWLVPDRNLGFGGACQVGANSSPADVYAFFNAHVTISRSSAEFCVSAFAAGDIGIVSPYLYHPGTESTEVNWKYTYCRRTFSPILRLPVQVPRQHSGAGRSVEAAQPIDNDWATGGVVFCRHELIRDIGWDGVYFLGFEDVDISMRARMHGWRIVVVPSAIAFHSGSTTRTSASASYYGARNSLWFARRYWSRCVQVLLSSYLLLSVGRLAAADVCKKRHPAHAIPAARGLLDGWLLSPAGAEALPGEPLWPRRFRR
jgi:N-acetylglucosaminyl-diphospho-decaprenol L-rhamnosyltransferase